MKKKTTERRFVEIGTEWDERLAELVETIKPRTTKKGLVIDALESKYGERPPGKKGK